MKLPKAVLFDLDDTILDTESTGEASWLATCERIAKTIPGLDPLALHQEIKTHRIWYWSDAQREQAGRLNLHSARVQFVGMALTRLGVHDPELPNLIASTHLQLSSEKLVFFPRALETLRWFRERNVPLGLITNGATQRQRWKIDRFQLTEYFGVIVVEGEFGVGKPHPSVFEHALRTLQVSARDTWMVGDKLEWDIGPPQALGIFGIWNDFRKAGLPPNSPVAPSRIIHSIAELMQTPD